MCCQGALKKGKNIAQGITAAITGKNEELYKHRLKICKGCPAFISGVDICSRCGCPINTKGRVHKEKCPRNLWVMVIISILYQSSMVWMKFGEI